MASRAWEGVFDMPFKDRHAKPRTTGLTMVIDKSLGLQETRDLMGLAADYIDIVKLTFGTSGLYERGLLEQKVRAITGAGVRCMPGGTFLELCLWQNRLDAYLERARVLGFDALEVSDGTIQMDDRTREQVIRKAVAAGFLVVSEVGKKDPKEAPAVKTMARQVERDLALGAFKVIIEAREAGRGVGIFDESGAPKEADVQELLSVVKDPSAIMWEAPLGAQQRWLVLKFGPNVNIGNVAPEDALALEALRCGLRADTLRLAWRANPEYKK